MEMHRASGWACEWKDACEVSSQAFYDLAVFFQATQIIFRQLAPSFSPTQFMIVAKKESMASERQRKPKSSTSVTESHTPGFGKPPRHFDLQADSYHRYIGESSYWLCSGPCCWVFWKF